MKKPEVGQIWVWKCAPVKLKVEETGSDLILVGYLDGSFTHFWIDLDYFVKNHILVYEVEGFQV